MMRYICFGALMATLFFDIAANGQENWPRFRGANATGVALDDPQLPDTWDTENNVKWVVDVPGWGDSLGLIVSCILLVEVEGLLIPTVLVRQAFGLVLF